MKNGFNFGTKIGNFVGNDIEFSDVEFNVTCSIDMSEKETEIYMGFCDKIFDYSKNLIDIFANTSFTAPTTADPITFDFDDLKEVKDAKEAEKEKKAEEPIEVKEVKVRKKAAAKKADEDDIVITDDEEFIENAKKRMRTRHQ